MNVVFLFCYYSLFCDTCFVKRKETGEDFIDKESLTHLIHKKHYLNLSLCHSQSMYS